MLRSSAAPVRWWSACAATSSIPEARSRPDLPGPRSSPCAFSHAAHSLRLVREAAHNARREAQRDAFPFSNWEIAARAVSNAMLGARTFLAPSGDALEPGLRAQATPVATLQEGFRDLTEAYLLEFLITRLGDIGSRDHVALAHALFRRFDFRVPIADLEDRVVLLLATLHDRITLRDDGIYFLSQQQPHAAAL